MYALLSDKYFAIAGKHCAIQVLPHRIAVAAIPTSCIPIQTTFFRISFTCDDSRLHIILFTYVLSCTLFILYPIDSLSSHFVFYTREENRGILLGINNPNKYRLHYQNALHVNRQNCIAMDIYINISYFLHILCACIDALCLYKIVIHTVDYTNTNRSNKSSVVRRILTVFQNLRFCPIF